MNFNEIKRDFTRYKATYVLSIITLLIWLWEFFTYGTSATSAFNLFKSGAILGQVMVFDPSQMWRLLTANFIHIGWAHVLLNVATLFFIGRQIENVFGWLRFTLIYLLSGIFGNAMVFLLTPQVVSAGASTSLFGLFAAVVGLAYFTKHPFLQQIGRMFTVLIVANLVMNFFFFRKCKYLGAYRGSNWRTFVVSHSSSKGFCTLHSKTISSICNWRLYHFVLSFYWLTIF